MYVYDTENLQLGQVSSKKVINTKDRPCRDINSIEAPRRGVLLHPSMIQMLVVKKQEKFCTIHMCYTVFPAYSDTWDKRKESV